jgi:hypothetical protein
MTSYSLIFFVVGSLYIFRENKNAKKCSLKGQLADLDDMARIAKIVTTPKSPFAKRMAVTIACISTH